MTTTPATPAEPAATATGRDSKGRFANGNKGGPGSPFNRRVADLRRRLLERLGGDTLEHILDRLVEMAEQGDLAAIKLVLAYTIGKPTAAVDPDRVEIDEFKLYCEETLDPSTVTLPLRGTPAALACEILGAALPAMADKSARQLGQAMQESLAPPSYIPADSEIGPLCVPSPTVAPAADSTPAVTSTTDRSSSAAQPAARKEPALPSVEQILAYTRPDLLPAQRDGAPASMKDSADSKRASSAGRAANQGP
jgi:hypothetical protein